MGRLSHFFNKPEPEKPHSAAVLHRNASADERLAHMMRARQAEDRYLMRDRRGENPYGQLSLF